MASTVAMTVASFLVVFLATIPHADSFTLLIRNSMGPNPGGHATVFIRCGSRGYFDVKTTLANLLDKLEDGEHVSVVFFNQYHKFTQWYCYFQWGSLTADFAVWQLPGDATYAPFRKVEEISWGVEQRGFFMKDVESNLPPVFIHPWGTTRRK